MAGLYCSVPLPSHPWHLSCLSSNTLFGQPTGLAFLHIYQASSILGPFTSVLLSGSLTRHPMNHPHNRSRHLGDTCWQWAVTINYVKMSSCQAHFEFLYDLLCQINFICPLWFFSVLPKVWNVELSSVVPLSCVLWHLTLYVYSMPVYLMNEWASSQTYR